MHLFSTDHGRAPATAPRAPPPVRAARHRGTHGRHGPAAARRARATRRCSTCRGDVPLEEWPADQLVALPRGISRHVVRFVRLGERRLRRQGDRRARSPAASTACCASSSACDLPAVEAVGVVTGREDADGEPLDPALVTRHLQFSLPYRALFSTTLRPDTADRLLDALAVLLVRLHLAGFYWGDCSLSNTLFRRDAGAFAAYLVDAETGELHDDAVRRPARATTSTWPAPTSSASCSTSRPAACCTSRSTRSRSSTQVVERYDELWHELTGARRSTPTSAGGSTQRIRRLNDLGFDVDELDIVTDIDGAHACGSSPRSSTPATTAGGCCG